MEEVRLGHLSIHKLKYWPRHTNKLLDYLDFFLTKGYVSGHPDSAFQILEQSIEMTRKGSPHQTGQLQKWLESLQRHNRWINKILKSPKEGEE